MVVGDRCVSPTARAMAALPTTALEMIQNDADADHGIG